MSNDSIEVAYNLDLKSLEDLLSNVRRPGNFFVQGLKELPLPKIEISEVGTLSFPVPVNQVKEIIEKATQAPFGRGKDTILDTSVRKSWQLSPENIKITGKSWDTYFKAILSEVHKGLGCQEVDVSAELYKLLIYDRGGFFLPHRDSEKSPGMFGTLVVVLPSFHQGGELVIYHAGQERILDLSSAEPSELAFAAFYADCEHEIRPIREGYRLCLVYNLIQKQNQEQPILCAPLYQEQITQATKILKDTFEDAPAPTKIVWLLEHQYTEAELSFSTLKNVDAAVAKVLIQAASDAGCAIHLGMVHIEESGSAEPDYSYHRHSRRRYYDNDRDDIPYDSFEVVDVCDNRQYIDGWITLQNESVNFGELPLEENELLPAESLDEEDPDEQRLLEATGNEGVSFERAYHRTALIIWPKKNYIKVLLQSGIKEALAYFEKYIHNTHAPLSLDEWDKEIDLLATHILDAWESTLSSYYHTEEKSANRISMLSSLCHLKKPPLIERLIQKIVIPDYNGTENNSLLLASQLLEISSRRTLFSQLIRQKMSTYPRHCISLLKALIQEPGNQTCNKHFAEEALEGFRAIGENPSSPSRNPTKAVSSNDIIELLNTLKTINEINSIKFIVLEIIKKPDNFDPKSILVPVLINIHSSIDVAFIPLWKHTASILLKQGKYPPEAPKDWKQGASFSCTCVDCKDLQAFAQSPSLQVCRFRVKEERRNHLKSTISQYRLDVQSHTDCTGSPYTLVCTKNRRTYEKKCENYQNDLKAIESIAPLYPSSEKILYDDLVQAIHRFQSWTP